MDIEQIKELATDINNVAPSTFQSGKEHAERPLLAKIERLTKERDVLLATIWNAYASLVVISIPIVGNPTNVATNDKLLKIVRDSLREVVVNTESPTAILAGRKS